jgi:hypothetical protein
MLHFTSPQIYQKYEISFTSFQDVHRTRGTIQYKQKQPINYLVTQTAQNNWIYLSEQQMTSNLLTKDTQSWSAGVHTHTHTHTHTTHNSSRWWPYNSSCVTAGQSPTFGRYTRQKSGRRKPQFHVRHTRIKAAELTAQLVYVTGQKHWFVSTVSISNPVTTFDSSVSQITNHNTFNPLKTKRICFI